MLDQKRKPDRLAAQRAALEETILGAAEIEFADKGFEGATTSAIAARAGLPKANLHYYFPTKAALYRRVVGSVLEAWLDAAGSFDTGGSAESALRRYVEAKMDLARARPLGSRIFAQEVMRGAPAIQDFLDTTLADWVRSRSAIVEGWVAAGELRPIDPKVLFYMIWAATQHYADFAHQIAVLNGGAPLDETAFARAKDEVVATLVRGVAADGSGTGRTASADPSTRRDQPGNERAMKLSARNQLKGTVLEVVKGQTTAHVRIDIGAGVVVTASVTNEAVDELGLKVGQAAVAVIKASDVMVGVA